MKTFNINRLKYFTLVTLMLLFSTVSWSQPKLQQAREMKINFNYIKAIELYKDCFNVTIPSTDDSREMAECYMMVNDTRSAEVWLAKVVSQNNHTAADIYNYANILKSNGKYHEAMIQYENYSLANPNEQDKADKSVLSCKVAMEWMADPTYFDVYNAQEFNSENCDFGLIPFRNGYILSSDRKLKGKTYSQEEVYGWTGNPYIKLLLFTKNNTAEEPLAIDNLNNKFHNGPGTFSEETEVIYFTQTKMVKLIKKPTNSDPTSWYDHSTVMDRVMRLEIFSASNKNNKWQEVKPFEFNKSEEYSVGHPALSPDGSILYFVSDMPGGYGKTDIYYCEKLSNGKWSTPKNAGNSINSSGKEVFPFIDEEGVLYFSSDGLQGMGGLDIFTATGSKNIWSEPANLKYPMNSPKDDFSAYFTDKGTSGYFSSNREGGKGEDDIYSFEFNPPKNLIIAVATKEKLDDNSLIPLENVNIKIENLKNEAMLDVTTINNSIYFAKADCNETYEITGTKDGYFSRKKSVTTEECKTRHDTVFVDLVFEKIVINKPIVIENIYYDFDKWNIRPDAAVELDKLVVILIENPEINIELGSHTDARGSFEYNRVLSQKRAESAVQYIISRGIVQLRITAKGYGESITVNQCVDGVKCTEDEHQKNRRTEFKVTSINKNQAVIYK